MLVVVGIFALAAVALVFMHFSKSTPWKGLHETCRGAGCTVVWPKHGHQREIMAAQHLADEIGATWPHITQILPLAAIILAKHGRLVAFSYCEAHLGPLFGRPCARDRFYEAMRTLSLVLWHDDVHYNLTSSADVEERIRTTADAMWKMLIDESDGEPPRVPHINAVVAIVESRWLLNELI